VCLSLGGFCDGRQMSDLRVEKPRGWDGRYFVDKL